MVLVSLGTGERTHKRHFDEIKDWGLAEWARPILDVVFDGASDAVDYQLDRVLGPERYWRLQIELTLASDDLDDATEDNLAKLRGHAEELIRERSADLDAVLAKLWRALARRGRCRPARGCARARRARSSPARRSRCGRRPTGAAKIVVTTRPAPSTTGPPELPWRTSPRSEVIARRTGPRP